MRTTNEMFREIIKVDGVNEHTISYEACNKIYSIFGIDKNTNESEIRQIRNETVERFDNILDALFEIDSNEWTKKMIDTYRYTNMWLSAITGAIDDLLFKKGCEV